MSVGGSHSRRRIGGEAAAAAAVGSRGRRPSFDGSRPFINTAEDTHLTRRLTDAHAVVAHNEVFRD